MSVASLEQAPEIVRVSVPVTRLAALNSNSKPWTTGLVLSEELWAETWACGFFLRRTEARSLRHRMIEREREESRRDAR